jgi:hypothetical protein
LPFTFGFSFWAKISSAWWHFFTPTDRHREMRGALGELYCSVFFRLGIEIICLKPLLPSLFGGAAFNYSDCVKDTALEPGTG